jgi:hypothetical protein
MSSHDPQNRRDMAMPAGEYPVFRDVVDTLKRVREWSRSQSAGRQQPHFGWMTLKQKEAALRTASGHGDGAPPPADPVVQSRPELRPKRPARRRVDLQSAQQHSLKTGVRKFRVRNDDDLWRKL